MLPLVTVHVRVNNLGTYHYLADVIGGIVTGTLGYVIGRWMMKTRGALAVDSVELLISRREGECWRS